MRSALLALPLATLPQPLRSLTCLLVLALAATAPLPALANGRFPQTNQLVVEPGNPDHVVVRATFGLLVTRDRGGSWDFVCEQAFGPQNTDPPLALLPGGRMLLGVGSGISRSDVLGCTFEPARGIDTRVVDVSASLAEPGTAFAVTQEQDGATFWVSTDAGETFTRAAEPLSDFVAVTLDVAPSNPERIYASGLIDSTGVLLRSTDRARHFERLPIPGASGSAVPYIAGIDPSDEDIVYVRTYGIPGSLTQTRDGGQSFEAPLQTTSPVQGFALSSDGAAIVVSNVVDGTFTADRDSFEFERVRCGAASCLGFAADDLLGCGSDPVDGFVVGRSRDGGATFSRLLALSCLPGPVACPATSGVGTVCPDAWPAIRTQIGADVCAPLDVPEDSACFEAGGAPGSGGTESGAGSPPSARPGEPGGDCGCRLPSSRSPGPWFALSALVLGLLRRRRAVVRSRLYSPDGRFA